MKLLLIAATLLLILCANLGAQETPSAEQIAAALKQVSPHVAAEEEREQLRALLGRRLREQIAAANRASSAEWAKIQSREDWERFRHARLDALRRSLGEMPTRPKQPRTLVTGRIQGDGFAIQNLVYESRPGLVVTANLYLPDPPRDSMPGILISHSHHNPKEQGELQDMGMTWARAGCCVLVPDHLGHGERRQHPFAAAANYAGAFQVNRQDYYFRYDTSLQLYLAGESLMGWFAHDLMTGVDLLLAQPGIDSRRIILLGSVAGGGDPAGVTAALDERIACVVPFNFGGPQPENRYPLPDDAESSFNYSGGGSWESTRNLARSAGDGFLPWATVGSVAPRHLIHAHEFTWDRERDPVWKRYQKIWSLYGATDRLAFTQGFGTIQNTQAPASHCNNIGAVHRVQIHEAFRRWFGIDVSPASEYSQRRTREELTCLTDEARRQFQPQPLHSNLARTADDRLAAVRVAQAKAAPQERARLVRESWTRLLGNVEPPATVKARAGSPLEERVGSLSIRRELLDVEPGITVPLMTLSRSDYDGVPKRWRPLAIVISQDGIAGFLKRRGEMLAEPIRLGIVVALIDVRGLGATSAGSDQGQQSSATAHSATHLMLGETLLAGQLRDVRATVRHLQLRPDVDSSAIKIVGDAGHEPLAEQASFRFPRRIDGRPAEFAAAPPLLALLASLYHEGSSPACIGGLLSFRAILEHPFMQLPHACVVPRVLREGDLPDLVAALAPRYVTLDEPVDGLGRLVPRADARAAYGLALQAYADANAGDDLEIGQRHEPPRRSIWPKPNQPPK